MTGSPVGAIAGVVTDGRASLTGLAFGDGALWAALDVDVQRLDPQTGRRDGTVLRPPSSPVAVAFGQGEVWVATSGYEVYGFRPGATSMEQVGRLTFEPSTLLDAGGYLWATDGQTLARIGPVAIRR
jgi:streptogramin lyase